MSPTLLIVLTAVVFAIFAIVVILKAKLGGKPTAAVGTGEDYEQRATIFSPAERSFFGVLEGALPDSVRVLGKVRLGDVFKTRKNLSPSQRSSASNRIDRKHVDFLLVRTSDLSPLAGIELDDSSHERPDRKARDSFVDDVFRTCKLPLLHVPVQVAYSQPELRVKIQILLA